MSQTTEQITVPAPTPPPRKRAAIVGTANTWKLVPWADPDLDVFGLNDGYILGMRAGHPQGLPKMTGWYDLHPISHMSFHPAQQRQVPAGNVPAGAYLRPEGHLAWLKRQTMPVWLSAVPAGWPAHVRAFPRAELEQKWGTYFTSTPAWMLAHLVEQGYTSIEIYGIHLATTWEYQAQRPCMEYLIGLAMARGVQIVLPTKCPLLKSKHVYAYEPKPEVPLQALETQIAQIKHEGAQLQQTMNSLRWYVPGRRADVRARLEVVQLELADAKQAYRRLATVIHAQ